MSERFDQMAASRPGPAIATGLYDVHVYEEGPITYLFVGAIHADREAQAGIRDWYLNRIVEHVEAPDNGH